MSARISSRGQQEFSARLSQGKNTARLSRSNSVPAFSSRSSQLSARYDSSRRSARDRRNRSIVAQNTARSTLDTSRSEALRITLGYSARRPEGEESSTIDPLWWYNPQRSKAAPLKSTFIDPRQVAKLKNHKTRKQLKRTIRRSTIPHITYDIDGDGVVNQTDMRIARQIDTTGKGTLTWDEREEGQKLLAKKFLEHNQGQRWLKHVAPQFANKPVDEAALDVANSDDFARTMFALNMQSKPGNGRAGRGAKDCLDYAYKNGWGPSPGDNDPLIKTIVKTARGNIGVRRAKSRSELFATRKKNNLDECKTNEPYKGSVPADLFKRVTLMTSPKAWTRCNDTTVKMRANVYRNEQKVLGATVVSTTARSERPKLVLKFPSKQVG
jgi:hypothetical protein